MCSVALISPPFTESELQQLASVAPVQFEWTPAFHGIYLVSDPSSLPDDAYKVFYHCTSKFTADASFLATAEEARRLLSKVRPHQCVNANAYSFAQLLRRLQQLQTREPEEPQTIVVVPVGIPAMGKSTLIGSIGELIDPNWSFAVVSSDGIRRECMEQYMRKNNTTDLQQAFDRTAKSGPTAFFQKLERSLQPKQPVHILFLDKNHPPNAIGRTLETLKRNTPRSRKLKTVLVLPETQAVRVGPQNFPMSLSLLLQTMLRLRDRPDHDTLVGSLPKCLGIQLLMYSLYRNVSFADMANDFDYTVSFPYTDERVVPEEEFIRLVTDELRTFRPGNEASDRLTHYIEGCRLDQAPLDSHLFMEQFIDVLQTTEHRLPPQPSVQQAKARTKPPMFVGVCLRSSLSGRVSSLLCEVLEDLANLYPNESVIHSDLSALSHHTPFKASGAVSPQWKFPQSLHLTTLFLGKSKQAMAKPEYTEFREGMKVLVYFKHVIYAPGRLICAYADTEPQLPCNNAYPHVTLLLGRWKAKQSNDLLEHVQPLGATQLTTVTVGQESIPVFIYELTPAQYFEGVTKAFD